ncbi:MAG: hypothetical protein ABIM88_02975 [candidate division WOR-3 bacterium]
MAREAKGRKRKGRNPLWIYLIISVLSIALSFSLFCSVAFLTEGIGITNIFGRYGEPGNYGQGLFFFCLGPLVLGTLMGTVAVLLAKRHRDKIAPVDEYIDAGISSLMEKDDTKGIIPESGDKAGGKTLSE